MSKVANEAAASKRETGGRFAKGNPGGPGNPFNRRLAEHRAALLSADGTEEVERVTRALLAEALAGDLAASKIILEYAVGKPQPVREPDWDDIDAAEAQAQPITVPCDGPKDFEVGTRQSADFTSKGKSPPNRPLKGGVGTVPRAACPACPPVRSVGGSIQSRVLTGGQAARGTVPVSKQPFNAAGDGADEVRVTMRPRFTPARRPAIRRLTPFVTAPPKSLAYSGP